MMDRWNVCICKEAEEEFRKLDGSLKRQVAAGIYRVSENPLPHPHGYGKPLGSKSGNDLTGLLKIKYKDIGIRVVYTLNMEEMTMNILVIGVREDDYCYKLAVKMSEKYKDDIYKNLFTKLIISNR